MQRDGSSSETDTYYSDSCRNSRSRSRRHSAQRNNFTSRHYPQRRNRSPNYSPERRRSGSRESKRARRSNSRESRRSGRYILVEDDDKYRIVEKGRNPLCRNPLCSSRNSNRSDERSDFNLSSVSRYTYPTQNPSPPHTSPLLQHCQKTVYEEVVFQNPNQGRAGFQNIRPGSSRGYSSESDVTWSRCSQFSSNSSTRQSGTRGSRRNRSFPNRSFSNRSQRSGSEPVPIYVRDNQYFKKEAQNRKRQRGYQQSLLNYKKRWLNYIDTVVSKDQRRQHNVSLVLPDISKPGCQYSIKMPTIVEDQDTGHDQSVIQVSLNEQGNDRSVILVNNDAPKVGEDKQSPNLNENLMTVVHNVMSSCLEQLHGLQTSYKHVIEAYRNSMQEQVEVHRKTLALIQAREASTSSISDNSASLQAYEEQFRNVPEGEVPKNHPELIQAKGALPPLSPAWTTASLQAYEGQLRSVPEGEVPKNHPELNQTRESSTPLSPGTTASLQVYEEQLRNVPETFGTSTDDMDKLQGYLSNMQEMQKQLYSTIVKNILERNGSVTPLNNGMASSPNPFLATPTSSLKWPPQTPISRVPREQSYRDPSNQGFKTPKNNVILTPGLFEGLREDSCLGKEFFDNLEDTIKNLHELNVKAEENARPVDEKK